MQTITRMDKVDIKDYYHMTTMDETVNQMKLTHLFSKRNLQTLGTLLYIYIYFKFLIAFLNVHTRKKEKIPLHYVYYVH